MANSAPQSNNVLLKFKSKPEVERMPFPAKAAAKPAVKNDIPIADVKSKVGDMLDNEVPLEIKPRKPGRIDKLRARGMISDKQAAKLVDKD